MSRSKNSNLLHFKRPWLTYFLYFCASCRLIFGLGATLFYLWKEYTHYNSGTAFSYLKKSDWDHPEVKKGWQEWKRMEEWHKNEYQLPKLMPSIVWSSILSSLIILCLYWDIKRCFELLFYITIFRFGVAVVIWTVSGYLGYEFPENIMEYLNLILENRYSKDLNYKNPNCIDHALSDGFLLEKNPCKTFDITWVIDTVNLIPRKVGIVSGYFPSDFSKMFGYYMIVMSERIFYRIRLSDVLSCFLWYHLYQIWLNIGKEEKQGKVTSEVQRNDKSKDKKIVKKTKQERGVEIKSNIQRNIVSHDKNFLIDSFGHSCLYGHKDNVRRILENFSDSVKINEIQINGNTAVHLAVFGNHLAVLQILFGKFGKELKMSLLARNADELNPLDLAVTKKHNAIVKFLCKHTKPEISSLLCAAETDQPEFVKIFTTELKKTLEKHSDLLISIKRFIDLSTEAESRRTTEERRKECKV